jgi:hypothetical protein
MLKTQGKLGLSKTNLNIKELFTLQLVFFDLVCVLINFFYYRNTLFSHVRPRKRKKNYIVFVIIFEGQA